MEHDKFNKRKFNFVDVQMKMDSGEMVKGSEDRGEGGEGGEAGVCNGVRW